MRELELLDAAVTTFGHKLSVVEAAHWTHPTPCQEWTVRDLVEHVVAGNNLAVELLETDGGSAHVHDSAVDPVLDFGRSAGQQRDAFALVDRVVEVVHPAGRITVSEFAVYRAADITVHAWDLARAVGADERLPMELVEHALAPYVGWVATLEVEGMFGPGPSGDHPGAAQDRLLDRLGRRP